MPLCGQTNTNSILQPWRPPQTTNTVPLSPGEELGKDIFFDQTLSNPQGYSCATCHVPQTDSPPSSLLNLEVTPCPA